MCYSDFVIWWCFKKFESCLERQMEVLVPTEVRLPVHIPVDCKAVVGALVE